MDPAEMAKTFPDTIEDAWIETEERLEQMMDQFEIGAATQHHPTELRGKRSLMQPCTA